MAKIIPVVPLQGMNVGYALNDIKRFNIDQEVCTNCIHCGEQIVQTLEDTFEYPNIGVKDGESLYWHCDNCGGEMTSAVTINVTIDINEPK